MTVFLQAGCLSASPNLQYQSTEGTLKQWRTGEPHPFVICQLTASWWSIVLPCPMPLPVYQNQISQV